LFIVDFPICCVVQQLMASELESAVWGETADPFLEEVNSLSNDELRLRIRALDNEIRIMKSNISKIKHEANQQQAHIKDNKEKIKLNKVLPYLVANVIEIVEPYHDPLEDDGSSIRDVSVSLEGNVTINYNDGDDSDDDGDDNNDDDSDDDDDDNNNNYDFIIIT